MLYILCFTVLVVFLLHMYEIRNVFYSQILLCEKFTSHKGSNILIQHLKQTKIEVMTMKTLSWCREISFNGIRYHFEIFESFTSCHDV